jgi:hypothetical protein
MSARKALLSWRGPKGAKIRVEFDADLFEPEEMRRQIDSMSEAYPKLPDEVPRGTVFVFSEERATHLLSARFRVGDIIYRSAHRDSLQRLWESVHYIDSLLGARHQEKAAS